MNDNQVLDGGTLQLTDDGIELPEMLKGYTGQFEIKIGSRTGQFNTTDAGLPETDYYDGPIAVYPEGGDYNDGIDDGEMVIQARGYRDTKFTVIDKRENNE